MIRRSTCTRDVTGWRGPRLEVEEHDSSPRGGSDLIQLSQHLPLRFEKRVLLDDTHVLLPLGGAGGYLRHVRVP